jgi:hypothetical protein
MTERDIISFLETEVNIATNEGDAFLANLYGRAIEEIKHLRSVVDNLKAEVQYYQAQQRD